MTPAPVEIAESRDLTSDEKKFVKWLLEHGEVGAQDFLVQLEQAKVCSRCSCGCASINFSVAGERPKQFAMSVVSDHQWQDSDNHRFGAFVFVQDGLLAGLDLWSIDGESVASVLPSIEALVSIGPLRER